MNSLIREALIEGKTAEEKYEKDEYAVKWTLVNDLELIFVVRLRFLRDGRRVHDKNHATLGSISAHSPTHLRGRSFDRSKEPLCQIL